MTTSLSPLVAGVWGLQTQTEKKVQHLRTKKVDSILPADQEASFNHLDEGYENTANGSIRMGQRKKRLSARDFRVIIEQCGALITLPRVGVILTSSTMKMRYILPVIVVALSAGCKAHVSITEIPPEDENGSPSYMTSVGGTSRALEEELRRLLFERTHEENAQDLVYQKIMAIEDVLRDRGYIIERTYILPSITGDLSPDKLQIWNIPEEIRKATSPACRVGVDYVDDRGRKNSPMKVTITERKDNFPMWENYLRTIDSKMKVEQNTSP